jgi:hypothetical protein
VPGITLNDNPSRGFLGFDTLTFDELLPGGQQSMLQVAITVK